MAIYLFDSHKEGSAVVRDGQQVGLAMGNCLLGLLEDPPDRYEPAETDGFYRGAGATLLTYDPEMLQRACALRLARDFLSQEIAAGEISSLPLTAYADNLAQELGTTAAWLAELARELAPLAGPVRLQPKELAFRVELSDLPAIQANYLNLSADQWAPPFEAYRQGLLDKLEAELDERIREAIQSLAADLSATLEAIIERLPLQVELYPAGLDNARRLLDAILDDLNQRQKKVVSVATKRQAELPSIQNRWIQNNQKVQAILKAAPALPLVLKWLPIDLRERLAVWFYSLRYGRQILQAQQFIEENRALLASEAAIRLEWAAFSNLAEMIPSLSEQIACGQDALIKLKGDFSGVEGSLQTGLETLLAKRIYQGYDPLYRVSVLDAHLVDWAFNHWQPKLSAWTAPFLQRIGQVGSWRDLDSETMEDWLVQRARTAYQPVWQLDLEEIFAFWQAAPEVITGRPLQPGPTLLRLMQAARPLVRPDFDASEGQQYFEVVQKAILGHPDWQLCKLPASTPDLSEWAPIYSGDPYTAILIQERRNLPLEALVDMIRAGRLRYRQLPPHQQAAWAVAGQVGDFRENGAWNDSPDSEYVIKRFQWSFQPKGSNQSYDQSIQLRIDQVRYGYYRNQPRLIGQWNRYAEQEMPEVRDLAAEFQRFHATQRWSTFNQAYNVLKFVQSCIPYARDINTTGHQDWSRYPIETLMEETGDCEDVAILCAAIIARLGLPVVLVYYPGHVAFGVAGAKGLKGEYVKDPNSGLQYYYGEATSKHWHLGEVLRSYQGIEPDQILPVTLLMDENDPQTTERADSL